ncbi:hypothetical protein D929_00818 [Enterococcus faecalis 02-MB-P-10]|uniref:hypothetical protein n=1 Tax=Enterococcus faecalis TaxID=1351 RepID=UPI000352C3D8|nr:hypothetical protein [Enterococcus faecalis]EPH75335.1 hypothetical protein D929_00818 [Enterococcus faecalis 02-MB-P-10]
MKNQSILELVKERFENTQNIDEEENRHGYHSRIGDNKEKQQQVLFLNRTNHNFMVVGKVINNRTAKINKKYV